MSFSKQEREIIESGEDPYALENPYSERSGRRRKKRNRRLAIALVGVLVVIAACFGGYAVWDNFRAPDFTEYASETIEICGLPRGDFKVSVEELSELECKRMSAVGVGQGSQGQSKAGLVDAYGPTLETFLKAYGDGAVETDFRRIKFSCRDGYTVILHGETLEYEVVMSIARGKNPLYEDQRPLRIVIPDEASGNWAYGVNKIEFIK